MECKRFCHTPCHRNIEEVSMLKMALDKIASKLCIKIWNQFFTCMRIWYRLILRMCDKNCYRFFSYVKIGYQFFTPEKQVAKRATIASMRAISNIWGLLRYSRAAYATVSGPILQKIEFIQNIIYVVSTFKF